jgi:hypothetical protein
MSADGPNPQQIGLRDIDSGVLSLLNNRSLGSRRTDLNRLGAAEVDAI